MAYDQFRAKIGVPRSAYEAIGKGTTGKLSSPAHLEDDRRAAADLLHQPALRDRVLRRGRRSRRERRTACHCAVDAARAPLRRALGSVGRRAAASPLQHVLTSTVTSHSETVMRQWILRSIGIMLAYHVQCESVFSVNIMRRSRGPVASSCAPLCPDCPDLSRTVQNCPEHRCKL